jgi:geranylgeranyl reductase family protein
LAGTLETDVLVVGAGPGGSAAAYHLARHGIDVTVIDKATFPREKVCGDGLTPRGVASLIRMGIDPAEPGFERVRGLRIHSKRTTIELPFPDLASWPGYGLVRTRLDLDQMLVERAQKAGARLREATEAIEPAMAEGWVSGAMVKASEDPEAEPTEVRARFTIAADGAASRFASSAGVRRDGTRPLGIAARRYHTTDHHPGPWFEAWLDLWEGDMLLPGYGWLFPLPDGTVNLGAGLLNTFKNFKDVSAQRLFHAFGRMLPSEWGISEASAQGRILSGPLPMSFNRTPTMLPGMLLVGDAAGAVNPFNGEGIAYAMETGEIAAELIHDALVSGHPARASTYPTVLRDRYARYFSLGRGFAKAIGHPKVMAAATRYMLPNERIMSFSTRMLINLSDGRDGDFQDKLFYISRKLAKSS